MNGAETPADGATHDTNLPPLIRRLSCRSAARCPGQAGSGRLRALRPAPAGPGHFAGPSRGNHHHHRQPRYFLGQLDWDAGDAQFMVDATSGMLDHEYGPWTSEDTDRLLAEHGAEPLL
jgi:hypothetical protein